MQSFIELVLILASRHRCRAVEFLLFVQQAGCCSAVPGDDLFWCFDLDDGLYVRPGRRLLREIKGGAFLAATAWCVTAFAIFAPPAPPDTRCASRTPPGEQAQVDFARFEVEFADEPGVKRIVWLFSIVLGYSRLIWARFVFTRTCRASCAATSPPSRPLVERPTRSFMIA